MPRAIAMHDVDDVERWLSSTKRDEIFAGVMEDMVTFVHPTEPNKVGLSGNIIDVEKWQQVMASPEGAAAMKHDGVHADTVVVMFEA